MSSYCWGVRIPYFAPETVTFCCAENSYICPHFHALSFSTFVNVLGAPIQFFWEFASVFLLTALFLDEAVLSTIQIGNVCTLIHVFLMRLRNRWRPSAMAALEDPEFVPHFWSQCCQPRYWRFLRYRILLVVHAFFGDSYLGFIALIDRMFPRKPSGIRDVIKVAEKMATVFLVFRFHFGPSMPGYALEAVQRPTNSTPAT